MNEFNRRQWLQAAGAGLCGFSMSSWLPILAEELASDPRRKRHCILLWMSGGPSQTDTFDMKPNHENGGEFKEIATNVPGVRFSEHLPLLAAQADKLAIVRSLRTKEGDHQRGTHLMRTGHPPMGPIRYPAVAASLAKHLSTGETALPHYVSIAPYRAFSRAAFGPGFLGPKYAPLVVGATDVGGVARAANSEGFAKLKIDALQPPAGVDELRMARRFELWNELQRGFVDRHPSSAPRTHQVVYQSAMRLMNSSAAEAFDLSKEPDALREKYGRGLFGQGCLMARRLVERGTSFVEVSLSSSAAGSFGWDTHSNNFAAVRSLSDELDAGWGTLLTDLDERGLLESTTILWMGEFGRTPQINARAGRDHFPSAWSCVFAGGGIAGGQAYGRTSDDGMRVEEGEVGVSKVLATLCSALGVPPGTQNIANTGRPLDIVEGSPIKELLL